MAGIVTSNKTRKLVGNRLKEIDVPTTTLNTTLFYDDLTAQGASYTASRVNAELNAYPVTVKNNASLALTPSANKAGVVYAMNGDSKTLEEFEFQRGSSGTYFDASGVMQLAAANVPRINYDAGVPKGLLIEPASSNLSIDSGINNGLNSFIAKSSEGIAGVDTNFNKGVLLAKGARITKESSSTYAYKLASIIAGNTYVLSAFIKMDDGSLPTVADLKFMSQTKAQPGFDILNCGNDVYRIYTTVVGIAGEQSWGIVKSMDQTTKSFIITGFQIEQSIVLSSYIPTTSAIVTRLADKVLSKRPTVVFPKNSMNVKTAEWPLTWLGFGVDNLNISGKNVFKNSAMVPLGLSSEDIVALANTRSFYYPTKPGEIWSISRDTLSNNRFRAVFTSDLPATGVRSFGGRNSSLDDSQLKLEGIVAPQGAKYIFVYLSNSLADVIPKIKIEKSSISTTYSPNPSDYIKIDGVGNIEISYTEPIHLQQFSLISRELSQEEV